VRQVMWGGIDCHRARMLGWIAESFDSATVSFVHPRPQVAGQKGFWTGAGSGRVRAILHYHLAVLPAYRNRHQPPTSRAHVFRGILAMVRGYREAARW
jgi:poly-beta-1,6-N-acetyl-D-glucosamine synthase